MTKITAHMVVKNEDQWIWYAIKSTLPYVDKFLITDTGSTDKTLEIINSFPSDKIKLNQQFISSPHELTQIRQKQLNQTQTEWFWLVDGDEIYPEKTAKEVKTVVNSNKHKLIVVRRYDLLGDIYHRQHESVGEYQLFGHRGHLVTRLLNRKKIPGLYLKGEYPWEGYFDKSEKSTQEINPEKVYITKNHFYHAMYLKKSSKGAKLKTVLHRDKFKLEKGIRIKGSVPSVFKQTAPKHIHNPLNSRSFLYEILATIITPIKNFKRKFL